MTHDILSVISAMAEIATATRDEPTTRRPQKPVVTISRDYGSGGDIIATRLAQRLEVPLYDEAMLHEVASRLEDDPAVIKLLDEGFGRARDMWLYRLFSGRDVGADTYRDTLVRVVMSLGRMGGVLVGRGAHVILHDACALKVRITGTPEICARRMEINGHGDFATELAKAHDVNHRRGKFLWDVFNTRLADASQFDISVNTDRMGDFEDVVGMLEGLGKAIHSGRVLHL